MNISATNSSLSSCSCCHNNGSDSSLDSYYYCFHCAILATATIESTRSCSSISDYNENNNDDDEERGIIISSSISNSKSQIRTMMKSWLMMKIEIINLINWANVLNKTQLKLYSGSCNLNSMVRMKVMLSCLGKYWMLWRILLTLTFRKLRTSFMKAYQRVRLCRNRLKIVTASRLPRKEKLWRSNCWMIRRLKSTSWQRSPKVKFSWSMRLVMISKHSSFLKSSSWSKTSDMMKTKLSLRNREKKQAWISIAAHLLFKINLLPQSMAIVLYW